MCENGRVEPMTTQGCLPKSCHSLKLETKNFADIINFRFWPILANPELIKYENQPIIIRSRASHFPALDPRFALFAKRPIFPPHYFAGLTLAPAK